MDERDLPAIERAANDAEILKWFGLHTRSPSDYLAAKRAAWAEGTGASFAISDATRPDTCLSQVFIERDDDGRGSVGYPLLKTAEARDAPRRPSGLWRHGRCQTCDLVPQTLNGVTRGQAAGNAPASLRSIRTIASRPSAPLERISAPSARGHSTRTRSISI
jgi:hypothetical protein